MAITSFFQKHPHLLEDYATMECLGPLADQWGSEIGVEF